MQSRGASQGPSPEPVQCCLITRLQKWEQTRLFFTTKGKKKEGKPRQGLREGKGHCYTSDGNHQAELPRGARVFPGVWIHKGLQVPSLGRFARSIPQGWEQTRGHGSHRGCAQGKDPERRAATSPVFNSRDPEVDGAHKNQKKIKK